MKTLFQVPKVETVIGRMDFILEQCKEKKVLHLGCVDEGLTQERIEKGELLHTRLMRVAKDVWGVDISSEGIELLKEHGIDNLVVGNIEQIDQIEELNQQNFDIILLTEVLEHLNNPGLFLKGVKKLFSPGTLMIITVPNGLRLTGLGYTLKGYESVHPDHNYWFSYKTLDTLMKKNGYCVKEILVYSFLDYNIPIFKKIVEKVGQIFRGSGSQARSTGIALDDIKPAKQRNVLKTIFPSVKKILNILIRKYLSRRNPFFVSDGIIIIVKPELNK